MGSGNLNQQNQKDLAAKNAQNAQQQAAQAQAAAQAQQAAANFQAAGSAALSGPGNGQLNISGSPETQQGGLEGLQFGQLLYGQGIADVGKEAAQWTQDLDAKKNIDYAGADFQRQLSNQALAKNQAKLGLGGTNAFSAQEQLRRQGSMQAAQMNQDYQDKLFALKGKSIGAKQSGLASQYLAGKGVGNASTPTPVEVSGGGTLGCLALVSLGLMSDKTYASEAPFINKESFQYIGYALIITPLIPFILKKGWFAKVFSIFAHKYVLNLTGEKKSLTGKMIKDIGGGFCSLIGRIC